MIQHMVMPKLIYCIDLAATSNKKAVTDVICQGFTV